MKKAQRPEGFKFDMFGEEWTVEIKDAPIYLDNMQVSGYCDADALTIVIVRHDDVDFLRKVFFHELFHCAVSAISNNNLRGKDCWVPEEMAAELSGRSMAQFMAQSWILPPWLFNRDKKAKK